jgi:Ca2+-binding EF-hand superfamily protein
MQQQFLKAGLEKKHPSIYSMIVWMVEVNEEAGIEGLTFDDFLNQSTFFFSQRHHDEGLRFIFELYD